MLVRIVGNLGTDATFTVLNRLTVLQSTLQYCVSSTILSASILRKLDRKIEVC